ncbi:hypothetical protein HanXRQr2_Chr11g0477021 [Helianthus annuus]|uniref:Uncharacterized protein n=1 Tax=Helianthus annuus TaxID=4232 RepID=A0A9K3HMC6_HELAN|nr:hypothetical protein HanXRQr2_Chr11g0477021 [Helianthus annuus]KAJ0874071.1 hypothetical protein HanPSC8_Chr11g0459801 [Helianthus annuus]
MHKLGNLEKLVIKTPDNELLRRSRTLRLEHASMVEGNGPENEFVCAVNSSKCVKLLNTLGSGPANRLPNKTNDWRFESLPRFVLSSPEKLFDERESRFRDENEYINSGISPENELEWM